MQSNQLSQQTHVQYKCTDHYVLWKWSTFSWGCADCCRQVLACRIGQASGDFAALNNQHNSLNSLRAFKRVYLLMQAVMFLNRFGQKAGNYDLVIAAARHYWNAIKPFIVEPIERELLREPMEAVLECIAAVAANEGGKEDEVLLLVIVTFSSYHNGVH